MPTKMVLKISKIETLNKRRKNLCMIFAKKMSKKFWGRGYVSFVEDQPQY